MSNVDNNEILRLEEENKALKDKNEELQKAVMHLYKRNLCTVCAYCGEFFEADSDGRKVDALQEHMQKCEKHPMTSLRARAEAAEKEIERLRNMLSEEVRCEPEPEVKRVTK